MGIALQGKYVVWYHVAQCELNWSAPKCVWKNGRILLCSVDLI